ncbi:hypothetical protein K470DRAFT_148057 [Piedraia hortae CBS 480.64]|uniref:Uncharacterized protein n=1 Tax=Piedraia hortae CBS 480.64 TaxID=1314780 RepID=A0A6A7BSU1_9PEZI|nr:hypothetical protein K470DRAFT_148057 [Piedraia hortae CBS 480.64]
MYAYLELHMKFPSTPTLVRDVGHHLRIAPWQPAQQLPCYQDSRGGEVAGHPSPFSRATSTAGG